MLAVLLAACFVMGGGSRNDVTSLLVLQPLAALLLCAFLIVPAARDWTAVRVPLLVLGALAAIIAVQLVPLPPIVWNSLPGSAFSGESAELLQLDRGWRPLTISPDLTLASLIGLVVPLAVLVGFAAIERSRRRAMIIVIIGGTAASALLGLLQISGGTHNAFYTFAITNQGSAVGLFANRNHQAVLLAMGMPLLAAWTIGLGGSSQRKSALRSIAAALVLLYMPLILVTGSRAGIVLGILGVIGAASIWRRNASGQPSIGGAKLIPLAVVGIAFATLAATIILSRAQAIDRLLLLRATEDPRARAGPVVIEMITDFFPTGSGFGTFEPLFRYYEPEAMIDTKYLNHAHNDLLEIALTGGLPALVILALAIGWVGRRTFAVWRAQGSSADTALARASSLAIAFVAASSVLDYPLRTPLMMAIVASACVWLGQTRRVDD